eukprot:3394739-Rhodomonas_salina.3
MPLRVTARGHVPPRKHGILEPVDGQLVCGTSTKHRSGHVTADRWSRHNRNEVTSRRYTV